MPKKLVFNR